MQAKTFVAITAALLCGSSMLLGAPAMAGGQADKPAIVLVHGAFADGSSWSKVIPLLQAKGYPVVAVQNPLSSLADDVGRTEHVINLQTRPVVLVGHSWAGVVITQAGNNPKVKALVYVDAFAPDSGQSIADVTSGLPDPAWQATVIKDEAGYLSLPDATIRHDFAQDLSADLQGVVAATQGPWFSGALADKVTKASWHDKPSWWVLGTNDRMIDPALQAKAAAALGAHVTKVPTSHVAMLADPKAVTGVIIAAADSVQTTASVTGTVHNRAADRIAQGRAASCSAVALSADDTVPTAREILGPAAVELLASQPPASLIADPPLPEALAIGRVVIQFRAENLRIVPVLGPAAVNVSPRIGHVHVSVDDAPWVWANLTGDEVILNGLPAGPHKVTLTLVNANHVPLATRVVAFEVPSQPVAPPHAPAVEENTGQPAAKLIVDAPDAARLANGVVFVQYRAQNLQIAPVYGPAALAIAPRVGHIHVTVDDAPWHWADASGKALVINGLPAGQHTILVELVNANHRPIDRAVLFVDVPAKSAGQSASTATAKTR